MSQSPLTPLPAHLSATQFSPIADALLTPHVLPRISPGYATTSASLNRGTLRLHELCLGTTFAHSQASRYRTPPLAAAMTHPMP
jgi:hypothetical protein